MRKQKNDKFKMLIVFMFVMVVLITFWILFLKFGNADKIYRKSYIALSKMSFEKRLFHTLLPNYKYKGHSLEYKIMDFVKNIIALIPFGFSMSFLTKKKRLIKVLSSGFIFSCFIELLQLFSMFGGIAINDMIANTLGSAAGLGCFILFNKIIKNNKAKFYIVVFINICLIIISIYAIYTLVNNYELFIDMLLRRNN